MSRPKIVPPPFEQFAAKRQLDTAPAVLPDQTRLYADLNTQVAFEAWSAGAAHLARMLMDSTLETEALRRKVRQLAEVA